ncbi:anti-sigma factor family protein [Kordia sp.]|uniref:anti-sigma factor family protein n=1 Tax=Kordia sp. TaxID=1965332 RepID=UPI003B5AA77E
MNREEIIQDYIANRLSEEEKMKVEALLETDVELQEMYETHTTLAEAFKLTKSDEIKARLQQLDRNEVIPTKKQVTRRMFARIAIAAVFIFGIFFTVNQLQSTSDFYESYFEVCPNTYMPITRGNESESLQFEAFKAYENKDFKTAETTFTTVLETTNDLNITFYYAMSLLNQEKHDEALAALIPLSKKTFDYQVESLWYTALIQLKNKETEAAKKNLFTLQQLNSNFKTNEIQSILSSLP